MSIHDFHSKLMSGKEESTLYGGLRRLMGIGKPALASTQEAGWTYWMEEGSEDGTNESGWAWETGAQGMQKA
ncbi:MAG TPA: hypothetical protein VNM67_10770 [Thermoanaerobaculia bacterium]|jgi:hypothetical protein|nr:hypothetical protein [Thermoanaerobaculia bacterium]